MRQPLRSVVLVSLLTAILASGGCNGGGISQEENIVLNPTDVTPASLSFTVADIFLDGNLLYVATTWDGLLIYDVSNMAKPRLAASVDLGEAACSMTASGNYAYITTRDSLKVIDVNPPKQAHAVKSVDLDIQPNGNPRSAFYASGLVYVAAGYPGIRIVNVDPPESAHLSASIDTPGFAEDVVARNGYAWFVDDGLPPGKSALLVVDARMPDSANIVASIEKPCHAIRIYQDKLFLNAAKEIDVLDITSPQQPTPYAVIPVGCAYNPFEVNDKYLFVAADRDSLMIYDISQPGSPRLAITVDSTELAIDLSLSGNRVCVVNHYDYATCCIPDPDPPPPDLENLSYKLKIVDVQSPETAAVMGSIEPLSSTDGVAIADGCVYTANRNSLTVIDSRQPEAAQVLGTVKVLDASHVAVQGDYAYVNGYGTGVRVIQVKPADTPHGVHIVGAEYSCAPVFSGSYLFTTHNENLVIVDISNPPSAFPLASVELGEYICALATEGGYVYAATWKGLAIIDVDPVEAAHVVCKPVAGDYLKEIAVSGSMAFASNYYGVVYAIDVTSPESPRLVGTIKTGKYISAMAISGNYLFASYRNAPWPGPNQEGLQILDISNPQSLKVVGLLETHGSATDLAVSGKYLYLADGEEGLRIIRLW